MKYLNTKFFCDAPVHWQTSFSEPASPTMEGIIEFHNHLMVILSFIALFVGSMAKYSRKQVPVCKTCHIKIHKGIYDGKRL